MRRPPRNQPSAVTAPITNGHGVWPSRMFAPVIGYSIAAENPRAAGFKNTSTAFMTVPIQSLAGRVQAAGNSTSHCAEGTNKRQIAPTISATIAALVPDVRPGQVVGCASARLIRRPPEALPPSRAGAPPRSARQPHRAPAPGPITEYRPPVPHPASCRAGATDRRPHRPCPPP